MNTTRRRFLASVAAVAVLPAALAIPRVRQSLVNVRDFGAIGDGLANDSAAFQAAREAVAEGGTIYVPRGLYCVNLLPDLGGISIVGRGPRQTVIQISSAYSATGKDSHSPPELT
jgi:hypothetical protein